MWTGTNSTCEPKGNSLYFSLTGVVTVGSQVRFGGYISKALFDKYFNAIVSLFVSDCGVFPTSDNVYVSTTYTIFNTTVHFMCNVGYTLHGYPSMRCNENGRWTNTPPVCTIASKCLLVKFTTF